MCPYLLIVQYVFDWAYLLVIHLYMDIKYLQIYLCQCSCPYNITTTSIKIPIKEHGDGIG